MKAAQNALGKIDAALYTFNLALEKDPKNPLCKFHRASILFGTGRHQEALQELEQLKDIVPKESLVYYLAGKSRDGGYHRRDETDELDEELDEDDEEDEDNMSGLELLGSSATRGGSGGPHDNTSDMNIGDSDDTL
ncbi:hypothetical protein WDU94_005739 [Cyamophila willieti]